MKVVNNITIDTGMIRGGGQINMMGTSQKVTSMGASHANFTPIQYLSYHSVTSKQMIINCAFNGKICMNQVNFTLKSF